MIEPATHFSVFETIKSAWRQVKGSKLVFFCISLLVSLSVGAQIVIPDSFPTHFSAHIAISCVLGFLFFLAYAAQYLLLWELLYVGVQRAAGQSIHLDMLRQVFTFKMFFRLIGTMLLMGLLFLPVLLLLFVGICLQDMDSILALISAIMCYIFASGLVVFLAVKLFFAQTIAVTEKASPWQAIRKSFQATKSNFWKLLGLSLINMYIIFFAMLPLGIGLIWAIPYSYINNGVVYRRLVLKQAD